MRYGKQATCPDQQGMLIADLRFNIHCREAIYWMHDRRKNKTLRVRARKTAVTVGRPLHRRTNAVAISKINIVSHTNFVAIVDHRCARHRQQQPVHQFHAPPVVLQQWGQASANSKIESRTTIGSIRVPEVVPFLVGHHLERQLIMVPQKHHPLAVVRNRGVCRMMSVIGKRSSRAIAMYSRGMSGK